MGRGAFKSLLAAGFLGFLSLDAYAAEGEIGVKSDTGWWDAVKVSGHLEVGTTLNPDGPTDNINFGAVLNDRANNIDLNSLGLIVALNLDPNDPDWQLGFRFNPVYGTDSRYLHFINEQDRLIKGPYQLSVLDADILAHLPILTQYGVDLRAGHFQGIEGVETLDPTTTFFYSHSYIFNFGVPFEATGVLSTIHVNPILYIYAGIDGGLNATIGRKGDSNSAISYQTGVQLNLPFGVTIFAASHIGPELPGNTPAIHANSAYRYYNDIDITWNINGSLTSTTDFNYVRDDGFDATAEGVAQYLTYSVDDTLSVGARAEIWRDDKGAFAFALQSPLDRVDSFRGLPSRILTVGKTTYAEMTLGLNYKIPGLPALLAGTLIRPEFRYDHSFDAKAYDDRTSQDAVTIAADIVVPF